MIMGSRFGAVVAAVLFPRGCHLRRVRCGLVHFPWRRRRPAEAALARSRRVVIDEHGEEAITDELEHLSAFGVDGAHQDVEGVVEDVEEDVLKPIAVPALARRVGMSASSFHKYFKATTSTTPLQYQKELRLLEARRLLRTSGASVTTAAYEVGYESPSQFSREYARKFGVPPSLDVAGAPG